MFPIAPAATKTANITAKTVTATVTASNKEYDGTTSATCGTTATLSGVEKDEKDSGVYKEGEVYLNPSIITEQEKAQAYSKNFITLPNGARVTGIPSAATAIWESDYTARQDFKSTLFQ